MWEETRTNVVTDPELLPVFWISNNIGAGFFPHFMLADEVARIGELEQQFGFVKNSAPDVATVPKGLAGITKAHSEVNATPEVLRLLQSEP